METKISVARALPRDRANEPPPEAGSAIPSANGASTPPSSRPDVHCRPIEDDDLEAVVDCLTRGFPTRPRAYWVSGLSAMAARERVENYPRFGFCLESAGRIVGVLLQIYSRRESEGKPDIRCNLSSWCVDAGYRSYALALQARAISRREITYLNISPAEHTRRVVEACGFRRINNGQMIFAPLLSAHRPKTRIVRFSADAPEAALLASGERKILAEHAVLGCRALIGVSEDKVCGFVFGKWRFLRGRVPCEQVLYCADPANLAAFAGALGRHLALRGVLVCVADANAPVAGLVGRYRPNRDPKYYRGAASNLLGDLAYTERAILGQ